MKYIKIFFVLMIALTVTSEAFSQTTKRRKTTKTTKSKTTQNTTLSNNDIASGLREALGKGVRFAIDELGQENGFLDNQRVKIPLPNSLQKLEKGLRIAGQGKAVDEFVGSMNHAAEKAVPVAIDVFVDAIKQITFNDAKNILFSGQDDSATQFFRRTSEETLRGKFRPIVEEFTEKTGVTQNYKNMIGKAGFAAQFLGKDATDLDGYVTQKALDGLFMLIADEEKKIRKDPISRTTSILQKVFGILK